MKIIGRQIELDILDQCMQSGRPEFIAVYGRRRIGKTFLIRNYFLDRFSFYTTGTPEAGNNRQRLSVFHKSLKSYGCTQKQAPKNWTEAFERLKALLTTDHILRDPVTHRRVVFIDELPWLDSPRSDFKMALDLFWNGWGCMQEDLCLIVCGSAASWIINNIILNTGGLYNRITRQIHLRPFSLRECEEYFTDHGIILPRSQIIESYMIWGGVPYYLNYYDRRQSFAQNVQSMVFDESGPLFHEHEMLFHALFTNPAKHGKVIEVLSKSSSGINRLELERQTGIDNGAALTQILQDLEQCDFIRRFENYPQKHKGAFFQLTDPFTLFYMTFIAQKKAGQWMQFINSPAYYAWAGHAFEIVCLLHIHQIKSKLGITGIQTQEFSWAAKNIIDPDTENSRRDVPVAEHRRNGAQIDLLIDRADNTITVCEIKFTGEPFVVTKEYADALINRRELLRAGTKTRKAVMIVMISANGISQTGYWNVLQDTITGDDLFR